jgi:hypothetical protein
MKNVYEVLRQKELELTRLEKEVEALRIAAPLLSEEKEIETQVGKSASVPTTIPQTPVRVPQPAVATAAASRPSGWEETAKRWP